MLQPSRRCPVLAPVGWHLDSQLCRAAGPCRCDSHVWQQLCTINIAQQNNERWLMLYTFSK